MLKRKIETQLAEWKMQKDKKPLVIKGIRQCGKTYIVQKFAKENCLLEQPTIKDNKKTVADYLAEESKKLGCELKVVRFVRF